MRLRQSAGASLPERPTAEAVASFADGAVAAPVAERPPDAAAPVADAASEAWTRRPDWRAAGSSYRHVGAAAAVVAAAATRTRPALRSSSAAARRTAAEVEVLEVASASEDSTAPALAETASPLSGCRSRFEAASEAFAGTYLEVRRLAAAEPSQHNVPAAAATTDSAPSTASDSAVSSSLKAEAAAAFEAHNDLSSKCSASSWPHPEAERRSEERPLIRSRPPAAPQPSRERLPRE